MSSMMCGMLLGAGVSAKKTYVDDVFSTYVYTGTGSARSINNGIDLSGEGGLVWVKSRGESESHILSDTVRGANNQIYSNRDLANYALNTQRITAFGSSGFSLGTDSFVNNNNIDFSSWTFRKAPGFFDVVTYTGNGSNRTISHSLECIPGCYMIKRTDTAEDWKVFHRSLKGPHWYLHLNEDQQQYDLSSLSNNTAPTASVFTVGTDSTVNANGGTYVCYLFAGGESTAATARSVDFDGTNDYLSIPDSSDFTVGTNYTAECWFYTDVIGSNGWDGIFGQWSGNNNAATNSWVLEYVGTHLRFYYINSGGTLAFQSLVDEANGEVLALKQWYHFAFVKSGSTTKLYLNGELKQSFDTTYQDGSGSFNIGGNVASGGWFNGRVSNVRIVNGTAVYTSSFKPPTAPLTNITNTKLLCCNDSSQTGSTVTPGTITNNGSTASTDSPFDDPAGFIFGENGDQNVIKCGSYKNDSSGDAEVYLGFEPQWLLVKDTTASGAWFILDSMRGIVTGGNDSYLMANLSSSESNNPLLSLTPIGFKSTGIGSSNNEYIFTAIRRSDGYVGKPPELGTGVFTMDTGSSSSAGPEYDSGFPVDFAIHRTIASTNDWWTSARLIQGKHLETNQDIAEATSDAADYVFDYNDGWYKNGYGSGVQSWMWKRHAGFDVVTYTGDEVAGRPIKHSLGKPPEMIWVKLRDVGYAWQVGHKGLNGGTNPWNYSLELNGNNSETSDAGAWSNTAPTSSVFSVGTTQTGNRDGAKLIAFLFASVDGISKVGSYSGSGSTGNAQNIGFQPRFLMIKRTNTTGDWMQFNSVGGFGNYMQLNTNQQQNSQTYVSVSSTGFSLVSDYGDTNESGSSYIYYAHA